MNSAVQYCRKNSVNIFERIININTTFGYTVTSVRGKSLQTECPEKSLCKSLSKF